MQYFNRRQNQEAAQNAWAKRVHSRSGFTPYLWADSLVEITKKNMVHQQRYGCCCESIKWKILVLPWEIKTKKLMSANGMEEVQRFPQCFELLIFSLNWVQLIIINRNKRNDRMFICMYYTRLYKPTYFSPF